MRSLSGPHGGTDFPHWLSGTMCAPGMEPARSGRDGVSLSGAGGESGTVLCALHGPCGGVCPPVSSRLTFFLERVVWSCPCSVSLALSCAQAMWVMARTVLAASPELETSTAALHPTLLTEAFVPSVMPAEMP